jgi:hypothetical protein
MKTQKIKTSKSTTRKIRKSGGATNNFKSKITKKFLEILNLVKLYHWKTKSYAQHQATDELYERLNKHVDRFVEVLLGKDSSRIKIIGKKIDLLDHENKDEFKDNIYKFRSFLIKLDKYVNKKRDSDLLTIRDDLLIDINQFLYLMTFDK